MSSPSSSIRGHKLTPDDARYIRSAVPRLKHRSSRRVDATSSRYDLSHKQSLPRFTRSVEEKHHDAMDPRIHAKRILVSYRGLGDEKPDEDSSRPLDGLAGYDGVISTGFRRLNPRNTDYYTSTAPHPNYNEFVRMTPQLVDGHGIMYRLADRNLITEYDLPQGNRLLRESEGPIGGELLNGLHTGRTLMWMARPRGRDFLFPTMRGDGSTDGQKRATGGPVPRAGAGAEHMILYEVDTLQPMFTASVVRHDVHPSRSGATGYVVVTDLMRVTP